MAEICGTTPLPKRVAQEDVRVTAERQHTFLNARAAGVVEADHRRSGLHREVHDLDDLLRVGFRERAAEYGEVLREDERRATVDEAVAGDEAVAFDHLLIHAEIGAAVADEFVGFDEGAFIEQQIDALTGCEAALGVDLRLALGSTASFGGSVASAEFFESVGHEFQGNPNGFVFCCGSLSVAAG